ncbi:LysM peptidoglycan-binding domain-containing protein [Otariodibacter sp.]|uniref:LysM peptidoglycan-binding domain-containing protein n=1 Tax=Otariodibacter sp. TaxID=3030919 RepID=UPI0026091CB9|nr:LysM peptidoglycan-binding domain-containing protein [Otariodibacter sp.]
MKKSFLLLPIVSMLLVACTTNSSSESSSAEVADANVPAWQTEAQPIDMPSNMNQPVSQPSYGYSQPASSNYGYTQPTQQQTNYGYNQTESIGNCQVVRDANNAPVYTKITKGCYTENTYTVGKSDTLFLISYLAGKTPNEIATLNNLTQPYQLKVGQVLRLQ